MFPQKDQPVVVAEIKKKPQSAKIAVPPPVEIAGSSPKNEADAAIKIQSGMRGMRDRKAVAVKRADSMKTKAVLDEATGQESIIEQEEIAQGQAQPRRASISSNLGSISEHDADNKEREEFFNEEEAAQEGAEETEGAPEEETQEEPPATAESAEEAKEDAQEEPPQEEQKEEAQEEPKEEPKV
eukprot:3439554-Rhodomonas_salina.1